MGALVVLGAFFGLWLLAGKSGGEAQGAGGGASVGAEPACIESGVPMTVGDLRKRLRSLGYEVDEGNRASLGAIVGRFQKDHGLAVKGSVDRSTEVYLRSLTPSLPPETWEPEW